MILIPSNRKWSQNNSGEVFGMLHATKNINFDKEGYAQLAKRPTALIYGVSNFETLVSCTYIKASSNSGYYSMTAARPFSFNLDGAAPTDLYNATGRLGDIQFDGVAWNDMWYISQSTSYSKLAVAAGTWTANLGPLSAPTSEAQDILYASGKTLTISVLATTILSKIYNSSDVLVQIITLPSNFEVRWIRYNHQRIYVGTKNITGGDAVMFVCSDATATSAEDAWPVPANWMFSGIAYKSSIVTITSRGQLLRFNGGGWDELANLPVYFSNYSWFQGTGYVNGRVEQRGMGTDGNIIYINLDGYIGDNNIYLDNQPSGLWVYDPNIGLSHKGGYSNDKYQTISITQGSTNTTTDVMTAGATYTALTGVRVWYRATVTPAGGSKVFALLLPHSCE